MINLNYQKQKFLFIINSENSIPFANFYFGFNKFNKVL